jgi:squalene-hopene/tetraprenyl-beta-curcumene cyclase
MRSLSLALPLLAACTATASAGIHPANPSADDAKAVVASLAGNWDPAAAAKYLDSREVWWQEWPHAQKDHGTVCVSCHTQVPYALARPALRVTLREQKISDPERAMLDSIITRVNLGNEAGTFYTDAEHGPGKTEEARNAEAVNNVVILVAYDAQQGHLQPVTRKALNAMWATQEQSGPKAGAWLWQNFHFSPWEAPESEYNGAAMAALAVGMAPDNYQNDPAIQSNLKLLRAYLHSQEDSQPLVNRITLLWASSKLPGLMTVQERETLANELKSKQHPDGGWSLTELGQGTWKRHDNTPFDLRSDGYATGLIEVALEENGLGKTSESKRGLAWILANQNKTEGLWPAWSVNVKRDPNSDIGKFMSDAATGFSVLALEKSH